MAMTAAEARPVAQAQGRYLYAIIDAGEARMDFAFSGLEGARVYALGDGRVAAVVSDLPNQKLRPERRRLAAHHEVLKRLMPEHVVLPMAFGLIAEGTEAVRRLLRLNGEAFTAQIERVRGRVEMGLRVSWDVPNIFDHLIASHPHLGALRDHIFRGGRRPSQEEKIELGRLFDQILTDDRAEVVERITHALRPYCREIKENRPRNEREIANLACLVDLTRQKEFEQGVIDAAGYFDISYAFDFNGPWPPHNFVDIDLQMS
ncbi:MAG TPA: GvpL/GvpF family gas vesicle protein [Isosphaeraceae bacterium]|jgi:hypothetical protein